MRFSNIIGSLPHPVLRPSGEISGYETGNIIFEMEVDRSSRPHQLKIRYEIQQSDIVQLVDQSKASAALAICCGDTYFDDVIDLPRTDRDIKVTFSEKDVIGDVFFCLIVKATQSISGFQPNGLIDGFKGSSFNIRKGDVLAISDELVEYYSLPPLRIGASIFKLDLRPALKSTEFTVDLQEADKIQIGVGSQLNDLVQRNMLSAPGRIANISAVYFPALIEVLYRISGGESFVGKAWFETLSAAANRLGVVDLNSTSGWEPLDLAQRLLRNPYIKLFQQEGRP